MGEGETAETPQGRALFEDLLWVHGMLRRDLETVRGLAADARNGRCAEEIQAGVDELRAGRPLWQLKMNCLHYCRFVEGHHRLEDGLLFPALIQADSGAAPAVERLQREHREVADRVERVEAAAAGLPDDDGEEARAEVAETLDGLGDLLLAHLEFEEESIGPTMRRLTSLGPARP